MAKQKETHTSLVIDNFSSVTAEAIQKLQTNISFAGVEHPLKVIGITSSIEGEGKSTLTVNMANTYAFRGAKVLIVNLDLRRPTIHRLLNIPNKIGITDYVTSDDLKPEDIINTVPSGIDIINAGTRTPFSTKILNSPKMAELIEKLRPSYDYILVDTPPVLLVTDAIICSKFIDGMIVVCSQKRTKKKDLVTCVNTMEGNHVNIIGVVMTEVKDYSQIGSGRELHQYYYGSENKKK